MTHARRVFDKMPHTDITSWHLLLHGYTSNGLASDALLCFQKMKLRECCFRRREEMEEGGKEEGFYFILKRGIFVFSFGAIGQNEPFYQFFGQNEPFYCSLARLTLSK